MFSRKEIKAIAERIRVAAQEELGGRYEVTYKGGSYGDTAALKYEIAKADASGEIKNQAAYDFMSHAKNVGLEPEDLGAKAFLNHHWYEITGLKPRAWKRPIVVRSNSNNRNYVVSAEQVLQAKLAGPQCWQPARSEL
jgi:hypothetical protein